MGSCLGRERSRPSPTRKRPSLTPLLIEDTAYDSDGIPLAADNRHGIPSGIPLDVLRGLVLFQLYDDPSPSECPYCEQPGMDKSNMMICNSEHIPYDMFEKLMERGWWRTGKSYDSLNLCFVCSEICKQCCYLFCYYLYIYIYIGNIIFQPRIEDICCPSYAIRMPPSQYKLTKKHRKVLNNWKNFLLYGDDRWENRNLLVNIPLEETVSTPAQNDTTPTHIDLTPTHSNISKEQANCKSKGHTTVRKGEGPDPTKPPCVKAKIKRRQKAQEKGQSLKGQSPKGQNSEGQSPTLLELIQEHEMLCSDAPSPKHKLVIELVPTDNPKVNNSLQEFFNLYNRFQDSVHPGKSKFKTSLDLHWGFVTSPLQTTEEPRPLGSFHMRYILDGELIMLSVLDILPRYLVSIYFIYDPAIRFLEPGIYTCLREMELVLKLQNIDPQLVYYNLGFYNDYSPKINYKRQFKPTEILCPITSTYVSMETALPLLRENKFCCLASPDLPERPKEEEINTDDVIVFDMGSMSAHFVKDLSTDFKDDFVPILQRYTRGTGNDVMGDILITKT